MNIVVDYAARSDIGLVRSNNQDSGYAGPHLLAVADGMGGHAGGDVASSLTVGRLVELEEDPPAADLVGRLEEAVHDANRRILERSREDPKLAGMGTTVTALLRHENKFALAHIGDSRAYLARDGDVTQVTRDHTLVQRLIDEGRMTVEEAERSPQRSVLMRVLGDVDADPDLDVSLRPARPGDRWLLCSDGLSGLVSPGTLARTLLETDDVGECADELVRLALAGGGPDNITCVVADVIDLDALPAAADGPSTVPQVVGSAAIDRNRPTAATGAAAKAAALARSADSPGEDDDTVEPPRRALWPTLVALAVIIAVLSTLTWLGYSWTQSQYFVGGDGENVVVYRGIHQELGPISLFSEDEVTDVRVEDLPPVYQDRVTGTITAASRDDADRIVENLAQRAVTDDPGDAPAGSEAEGAPGTDPPDTEEPGTDPPGIPTHDITPTEPGDGTESLPTDPET